jgi:enoyl-CoA hydratase
VTVRVEHSGPVTTVIIDRAHARNAVDRATAEALADAFRAFDADDAAACAVLWGAGGTFCAGADLKALDNRVEPDGDAPMGRRVSRSPSR